MSKTHDYTTRGWGHDYVIREVIDSGNILKCTGWGDGIRKGDMMLLENKGGPKGSRPDTRYKVKEITYYGDPSDMWTATLEFAPRPAAKQNVEK